MYETSTGALATDGGSSNGAYCIELMALTASGSKISATLSSATKLGSTSRNEARVAAGGETDRTGQSCDVRGEKAAKENQR